MGSREVFIVDDEACWRGIVGKIVREYSFVPIVFEKPRMALEELRKRKTEDYPSAYFVDKLIISELKDGEMEGASAEELFDFLNNKGLANNFYFLTVHNDTTLRERTGRVISKFRLIDELEKILVGL